MQVMKYIVTAKGPACPFRHCLDYGVPAQSKAGLISHLASKKAHGGTTDMQVICTTDECPGHGGTFESAKDFWKHTSEHHLPPPVPSNAAYKKRLLCEYDGCKRKPRQFLDSCGFREHVADGYHAPVEERKCTFEGCPNFDKTFSSVKILNERELFVHPLLERTAKAPNLSPNVKNRRIGKETTPASKKFRRIRTGLWTCKVAGCKGPKKTVFDLASWKKHVREFHDKTKVQRNVNSGKSSSKSRQ
ncbi:uncharacterized protein PAC_07793 [Phialocephala subalpina]|uniref:C2H2-type domain-containing protein n=1 Tax=Phialocephala subalpina TaxID=576137 RepID=A0A1L7WYQ2_9HELO|nr:uncharacterized protein PAC_07793 [Phialocephala subalpina]